MEFKKRKEKKYRILDESKLDEYTDKEIEEFLQKHYISAKVLDQTDAYGMNYENLATPRGNKVLIQRGENINTNIAFGGCGVWNGQKGYRILATIREHK